MKKRDKWIEKENERIEPIITEEVYNAVQEAIESRCIAGNRGKNISRKDTSGKLKCGLCGANYILALDTRLDDEKSHSYYICSHKKSKGKSYCNSKNIKKSSFDKFIEDQRTVVYPSSAELNIKLQIRQLKNQISQIDSLDVSLKNRVNEEELKQVQAKIELLLNNLLENTSQTTEKVFTHKLNELENKSKEIEEEINNNQLMLLDKERYKRLLDSKIKELEKQKGIAQKALSREEYLKKVDSFIINSKEDIQVILI